MATKTKTIKLQGPMVVLDAQGPHYKIIQVTDTVEFGDKRYLSKKEVQELCEAKDWKVTITG